MDKVPNQSVEYKSVDKYLKYSLITVTVLILISLIYYFAIYNSQENKAIRAILLAQQECNKALDNGDYSKAFSAQHNAEVLTSNLVNPSIEFTNYSAILKGLPCKKQYTQYQMALAAVISADVACNNSVKSGSESDYRIAMDSISAAIKMLNNAKQAFVDNKAVVPKELLDSINRLGVLKCKADKSAK